MKRGALPLNALRAFEATGRLGRMTLAAEELGVTHSAVSRQIRSLEKTLGVVLFEGARNRLAPSAAAMQLLPDLTRAFDGIESAVNRIATPDRRALDVSCIGTLAMRWLIPRLYDFQNRYPAVEIRLTSDDGPVDFARQRLDTAIRVGAGPWPDTRATLLFDDRVGPVLSPRIAPEAGIAVVGKLSELPRLHTRTRLSAWPDWCRRNGAQYDTMDGRTYEHFYFMLEAATAGLGVAIAPEVLVRDDVAAGRLIAPFGFQPSGQSYVALLPEAPRDDARRFVDWLTAIASHADASGRCDTA